MVGGIRQHRYPIRPHFHKPAANCNRKFLTILFVTQLAKTQRRKQWLVARQDTDDAIYRRRAHIVHVIAHDDAFDAHDIEMYLWHQVACPTVACCTGTPGAAAGGGATCAGVPPLLVSWWYSFNTSSIVPCKKK